MTPDEILPTLVHAIDRLDWTGVRALFADVVAVDYSELSGIAATDVPANDLLDQWKALLPGFTATQHLLGPSVLDSRVGPPVVHAHVRAWHYLPDADPWIVAGHYEATLDATNSINGLTLRVTHVEGPPDATDTATSLARTHPRESSA